MRKALLFTTLAAAAIAAPLPAQQQTRESVVSIYRAAPGHQTELLKWFAQQDAVAQAAGLPTAQLYIHRDGASWDFVVIQPNISDAEEKKMVEAAQRLGVVTGPRIGLQLRQHIAEHSDTFAAGPTTAAEWLKVVGE